MPRILVKLFDIDGCLFNDSYLASKDVVAANPLLIAKHEESMQLGVYDKVYAMLASLRQCIYTDNSKCYKKFRPVGSAFPAILKFSEALKAEFYPFLLADVFGDLPIGQSFDRALECLQSAPPLFKEDNLYPSEFTTEYPQAPMDETKVLLLYAQIHALANFLDSSDEVDLELYDDSYYVLDSLSSFFNQHLELIPKHFTVHFFRYEGQQITAPICLQGTGEINTNFRETTKDMAKSRAIFLPTPKIKSAEASTLKMPSLDFSLFTTKKESTETCVGQDLQTKI